MIPARCRYGLTIVNQEWGKDTGIGHIVRQTFVGLADSTAVSHGGLALTGLGCHSSVWGSVPVPKVCTLSRRTKILKCAVCLHLPKRAHQAAAPETELSGRESGRSLSVQGTGDPPCVAVAPPRRDAALTRDSLRARGGLYASSVVATVFSILFCPSRCSDFDFWIRSAPLYTNPFIEPCSSPRVLQITHRLTRDADKPLADHQSAISNLLCGYVSRRNRASRRVVGRVAVL